MVQRFLLMRGSCPSFDTFRGVVVAKWEQKPGPARAPSRPWFGSRMFSRRTTSPVLSEPLARRALVVGVSRAPGSPTDTTERFLLARERASQFHPGQRPTNAATR